VGWFLLTRNAVLLVAALALVLAPVRERETAAALRSPDPLPAP
jgi:hypothetical protein